MKHGSWWDRCVHCGARKNQQDVAVNQSVCSLLKQLIGDLQLQDCRTLNCSAIIL